MADPRPRSDRYAPYAERLVACVTGPAGHTGAELRRAALARAAQLSGGGPLPPSLAGYVDKVARHAYQVTDQDVGALQSAGNSDDAIFEITVAAALGAALGRLERGLAALASSRPER